ELSGRAGWSVTVSDDGEGMSAEDLALAFQRHATSKLTDLADFDRLTTLGFRGEALPSIASVSRVRAASARRDADEGAEIRLDGGRVEGQGPCAPRAGTVIEVTDLFGHTPARKKFLKSPSTELGHACSVLQQHALARPDVAWRASYEGRRVLDYPAAGTPGERMVQIYGHSVVADRLLPIALRRGEFDVTGWCSRPEIARASRRGQEWFVNGRPVRHPLFLRAVDQAYATRLMSGRYPVVVLLLRLPPSEVDVNVHPAKRDVRFARPDDVARLVIAALDECLSSLEIGRERPAARSEAHASGYDTVVDYAVAVGEPPAAAYAPPSERVFSMPAPPLPLGPSFRFLGQFDRTYLIAEIDGELRVIDQHAAHERVLYERLLADDASSRSAVQPLLVPETIEYPADQACAIAERLDLLRDVGIEIESFGGTSFVLRALPAVLAGGDCRALVWAMVDALESDEIADAPDPRHRLLATIACHAAIKAHQRLDVETMTALLRDVIAVPRNATCPHGRPVALTWTLRDLEHAFGRRG
ncbi:MAG: DNA mismatch repair endonuclease MutL, partial [Nitrospiria bacterium]